MKKALILLLVSIITISCSSNDEETTQDPIIGGWYPFSKDNVEVSDCGKNSRLIFQSDNTLLRKEYYPNPNNDCILDFETTLKWSKTGNNRYEIISRDGNDRINFEPTFSSDNSSLSYIEDGVVKVLKRI